MKLPSSFPIARDLVFIGGGHTHALVLRMLGMDPLPGVELTLVSDVTHTPYSGMLPGFIAGHYDYDEVHIDLRRLCQFANVRFIRAKVEGMDLEERRLRLEGRPAIAFDVASINIGSTPLLEPIEGAHEFGTPVKPVPAFLRAWEQLLQTKGKKRIVLIGGGAAGVEVALSMRHRLPDADLHLIHRQSELLSTHPPKVRRYFETILKKSDITVHLSEVVQKVSASDVQLESKTLTADHVFYFTQASAAAWPKASGLGVDADGFIQVGPTLQTKTHSHVFACGDIASMESARPKSGVFAVRQAKPLYRNLRYFFHEQPLKDYHPQPQFLSLIGTGTKSAVASRGEKAHHSRWLWTVKESIDRRFMKKFSELTPMSERSDLASTTSEWQQLAAQSQMRCQGCAAKVGPGLLEKVLSRLGESHIQKDDAAVVHPPVGKHLVQTVDAFPAFVTDPYSFGQILVHHCFGDLFAMGAQPHSAQVLLMLPFAKERVMEEMAFQVLSGITSELKSIPSILIGGHTMESEQLGAGLVCNGWGEPKALLKKASVKEGDQLILTKPLGTGTLLAAEMRLKAKGRWIDEALQSMRLSNQKASEIFVEMGANACTDVTGFGLVGHLNEMLKPSGAAVQIELAKVPILRGALETSGQLKIVSSLYAPNRSHAESNLSFSESANSDERAALLFDPQTSGGLLASVPASNSEACVRRLREAGYPQACSIGVILASPEGQTNVTIV